MVPLALRGFRLVAHAAVAHAIEEIDSKPDDQPDNQPEPCVAGQTYHEQNGGIGTQLRAADGENCRASSSAMGCKR